MGSLEDRLRRLEEQLIRQPSAEEYLDASNREQVRALHALAERLEKYRLDGDYLFAEANRRILAEDTPEKWERDREIIEAWHTAQGMDRASEVEGAGEKLLARLELKVRSSSKLASGRSYSPSLSPRWKSEGTSPRRSGKWIGG